jgi:hypothetical protein
MNGGKPSNEKRQYYKEKLKWLDLSKYKAVRNLSALDWRDQLAFRRDLMDKAKFWISHRDSELPNPELEEDLRWLFATVQESPLIDFDQLEEEWRGGIHDFPMLFFLRNTSSYLHLGVHATTVEEFYLAEAFSHPDRLLYARQFFDELGDIYEDSKRGISIGEHFAALMSRYWQKWDDAHCPPHSCLDHEAAKPGLQYQPWMEEPLHQLSGRRLFLTVDTAAPDSRLEKEFHRVLVEHRASTERVDMPNINTASWADAGLLPLLCCRHTILQSPSYGRTCRTTRNGRKRSPIC